MPTPRSATSPLEQVRHDYQLPTMDLPAALARLRLVEPMLLRRLRARSPELFGRGFPGLVEQGIVSHHDLSQALALMAGLQPGAILADENLPHAVLDLLFPQPTVAAPTPWPAPATTPAALDSALDAVHGQPLRTLRSALEELRLLDRPRLDALQAEDQRLLTDRSFLLVRRALLSDDELGRALARVGGLPEVDASLFEVEPHALDLMPPAKARVHGVLPLALLRDMLFLASGTPDNRDLRDRLAHECDTPMQLVWAADAAIRLRLQELETHALSNEVVTVDWKPPVAAEQRADGPDPTAGLDELVTVACTEVKAVGSPDEPLGAVGDRSGMAQLVRRMLLDARNDGASDVHIEVSEAGAPTVRMRVDGEMRPYGTLPALLRPALVSRIKVMARLDIAEHRRPQDGKILMREFEGGRLEVRVAVLPTHDGMENVVLRLLGQAKPLPLADLGLQQRDQDTLQRLAQHSFGLLLVAGPTGSGKTTTLHSMLRELNTPERKIWTVEDPIEISQPGLNQVQVNPKINLTFAAAMRSFLRADPDVIMVGEIRDAETAGVALDASLTGHLVLSTLHTNNVGESVLRLLELGLDPMNFGDSLLGVVAQRLVRALCPRCRRAEPVAPGAWREMVEEYARDLLTPQEAEIRLLAAAGVAMADQVTMGVACG